MGGNNLWEKGKLLLEIFSFSYWIPQVPLTRGKHEGWIVGFGLSAVCGLVVQVSSGGERDKEYFEMGL